MLKKLIRIVSVATSVTLALTLTACVQTPADQKSETIKIGAIFPLTGDGAGYGVPLQKVANIAIDKINSEGGVNGQKLEFLWEDGKCDGKSSAAAAQKLINVDKVKIILGAVCSSETLGIAPIAQQAKVVVLSPASTSPDITTAGDFIFRNYPSDSAQGQIIAHVASEKGFKKIGILTEQQDYPLGIEKGIVENFEKAGGTVIKESFLGTDTDVKIQLSKLLKSDIEAVFINPQTVAKADLVLKQLKDLGKKDLQLMVNDVVIGYQEGLKNYPDLLEGSIGAEPSFDPTNSKFQYLSTKYKEQNNNEQPPFSTYSAASYDAVYLIAEGIKAVGYDAAAFKEWLYKVKDWQGALGKLTIDSNGDPLPSHVAKQVKEGKVVPYEDGETAEEMMMEEKEKMEAEKE